MLEGEGAITLRVCGTEPRLSGNITEEANWIIL